VIPALRLHALAAARDRGVLPPVAALAFVLLGVFAYRPNDVATTWALTALLALPLTAWLCGAVLRGVPDAERDLVAAALGGVRTADAVTLALGALLAALVTAVLLAYPLAIGAFDRPVIARDLADAALAHLACALLGAQLARAVAPPLVTRRADAAVVVVVAVLATVAADAVAGPFGGPMSVSSAFADRDRGELLVACAGCLVLAGLVEVVRRAAARRLG
jgi:hypothetical protein